MPQWYQDFYAEGVVNKLVTFCAAVTIKQAYVI